MMLRISGKGSKVRSKNIVPVQIYSFKKILCTLCNDLGVLGCNSRGLDRTVYHSMWWVQGMLLTMVEDCFLKLNTKLLPTGKYIQAI